MDRNCEVIIVISEYLYTFILSLILRRPRVANSGNIANTANMFIKTTFKDSKKVKGIKNYVLKCNLYLHFLIQQKLLISAKKMLMSTKLNGCVT